MNKFKFHYPIEVRFGDLDAYWHVNNARFLVYLEDARSRYVQEMGLVDGKSLWRLPLIVGDIHIRYRNPIELGDKVIVSMGATRISGKTVTFEYEITGADGTPVFATAESIMVCYDYQAKKSVPVSDDLRRRFSEREGKEL
ncbi:MAG TPA: thioesterase family protein [Anaerolineaceae bacterium]|nr:thioesterase family protein [Anaerolineaceae bacterium]